MNKEETFTKTNKLSVLLSLALDDFELANNDPNYKINMDFWHCKEDELEPCTVCLAGSVLAKTFEFDIENIYNDDLGKVVKPEILKKIHAIDSIREGDLLTALWNLNLNEEEKAVEEILNIANDDINFLICSVELILGESMESFEAVQDCKDFKYFVTFYRRLASKLKEVEL